MSEKNKTQVQLSIQTVDSTASQILSLQYAEKYTRALWTTEKD